MAEPFLFSGGILSSFYMDAPILMLCPLCGEQDTFAANEHYFHCYKATLLKDTHDPDRLHELYEAIRDAPSAKAAKDLGRALPLDKTGVWLWDHVYALEAMLKCNLAKFYQHEHCREFLLSTGQRPLVEHRPDPIWGDNMNGSGRNQLGKVLELVRARVA